MPWSTHVVAWLLLAILLAAIFALSDALSGRIVSMPYLGALALLCSALWLLSAPLIWRFTALGQFSTPGSLELPLAHFAVSIVFAVAWTGVFSVPMWWVGPLFLEASPTLAQSFRGASNYFILPSVLFYWLVVGARCAFDLSTRLASEETRRARAEEQLVRWRLDVLRMQMSPHFLFNTLNTVSGLVRTNRGETAVAMIAKLGKVLRGSLEEDGSGFAPVEGELAAIEDFVEIERCRFGDRLDFAVEADPSIVEHSIPRWMLQPLVENAIRHGLEGDPDAGRVRLRIAPDGPWLRIDVEDDGAGLAEDATPGVGLRNTRQRLEDLYADLGRIDLDRLERGTRVTIRIPLERTEP